MSSFLKSHRGLSGLEYMAIIVVVMTGILLGGPYVMRAVNAPFRSIEQGAIDSAREDIKQGADIVGPLPVCDCTPLAFGCGDGTGDCDKTEALWRRTCAPLGCEVDLIARGVITVMQECRPDSSNTCCLDPVSTGNCGALASHVSGGCPAGEMEVKKMCGSPVSTPVYECLPDPSCLNDCQPFGSNVKGWCDELNYKNGVIGSQPPRVVDYGHCNDDVDMRCKAECKDGYYASGTVCLSYCGNGTCEDGTGGKPDYGEDRIICPEDCSCSVVASPMRHCDIDGPWGWRENPCPLGTHQIAVTDCPSYPSYIINIYGGSYGCYAHRGPPDWPTVCPDGQTYDINDECCWLMCEEDSCLVGCGNATKDDGEECDDGRSRNGTCPSPCSAGCKTNDCSCVLGDAKDCYCVNPGSTGDWCCPRDCTGGGCGFPGCEFEVCGYNSVCISP